VTTQYKIDINEKGIMRSCLSSIARDLIEPNVLKIPIFSAGNKNVTQNISSTKLQCPSSLSGSIPAGRTIENRENK
jgi:hypothetical protein